MTASIQFDQHSVQRLMQDIQSHVKKQSSFEQSDLFKLMLQTFIDSDMESISSSQSTPPIWRSVSAETIELFFQVMSDPPLSYKKSLSFENFEVDSNVSLIEHFEKHGLHISVNWENASVYISKP